MSKDISIIIPVINEAASINQAIENLRKTQRPGTYEIIVVDGDASGNTLRAISDPGVEKIKSPCGRGVQMNAGARAARGRILLFLHADTCLPDDALDQIIFECNDHQIVGGAFDLGIDSEKAGYRLIEIVASRRSRLTQIPYGDQAIFLRKKTFFDMGGFAEFPIMEDIDLMRRIRKAGYKIKFIPDRVRTSPRRWEREGRVFVTLRNFVLSTMFYFGVGPVTLKKFYK